jgi:hypothetical protein
MDLMAKAPSNHAADNLAFEQRVSEQVAPLRRTFLHCVNYGKIRFGATVDF